MSKFIGLVSAYAYAQSKGYTGTEEEFAILMAEYASVTETAVEAVRIATESAQSAAAASSDVNRAAATVTQQAAQVHDDAETSSESAATASEAKETAVAKALDSEAWAVGTRDGEDVGSSDPAYHNNAKYYAESVGSSAQAATEAAQTATTKASEAQASASAAAESARTLTIDATLTQAGQAADAKETGDKINIVKEITVVEEVSTVTTNIFPSLSWTEDKYMGTDGIVRNGAGYRYSNKLSVSSGDVFAFANPNFDFGWIAAFNGDAVVTESGQQGGKSYIVPHGIDGIVITENTSRGEAAINRTETIKEYKNALDDDMASINSALTGAKEWDMTAETSASWTNGKYMSPNGGVTTANGLNYSSEIPVSEGDILLYKNNNYKFRFVCAYNSAGTAVADKGSANESQFYVVPSGIVSIVVTVYDTALNSGTDLLHISAPVTKKAKIPSYGIGSVIARADTMTDESTLTLPGNNCKIGSRYQFSCKVSEFGSVEFAMGTTHVVVDETNIIFKNGTTTQVTVPHGLTIESEFLLVLQNETTIRPSYVSVSSLGNRFEYNGSPNITFLLDNGIPTIKCIEGTLSNCAFSFTSSHIFKPIWIFGDSYLSWLDARWTYYAAEDGNTENVFFSGYAGQNSQDALAVLNNELKLATPKVLVWCLGMNDPDAENVVNSGWNMVYAQIKEICAYRNIELVLYTTPTTPIMNNRHKNAIVRASGYRYVDIDGLLRINDSGNWIDGTLAGDNVHPTPLGAKVIYQKFLSDLPEIMTK